jgi:DNA repair protein RecO (recombination protein O)
VKTVKTQAIVLRRTNYGEADRILQLLTPNGKRCVMVKGARREKSRLAGGIELFAICEVVLGDGKGEIGVLTSARLIHFYRHIMEDYDRMQFAYLAIKLVSKSCDMVDGPEWYDVLAETLAGLDAHSVNLGLIQTWFYLKYSSLMGYELSLWHDVCGDKLLADNSYSYDIAERGLRLSDNGDIGSNHIKLLRLISTRSLKVLAQVGGIEEVIGTCMATVNTHASI